MSENRLKYLELEKVRHNARLRNYATSESVLSSTLSMNDASSSPRFSGGEARLFKSFDMYSQKVVDKVNLQEDKYPELPIQMFFEFMRTAYQVNDNFAELFSILSANSELDWTELAKIDVNLRCSSKNNKNVGTEDSVEDNVQKYPDMGGTITTSDSQSDILEMYNPDIDNKAQENSMSKNDTIASPMKKINNKSVKHESIIENNEHLLGKLMKKSLSDVLHEGLLDSVLAYMLPKPSVSQPIIKKSIANTEPKKSASLPGNLEKSLCSAICSPYSSSPSSSSSCSSSTSSFCSPSAPSSYCCSNGKEKERDRRDKTSRKSVETEVEIHVCDEAKNVKKDFRCPQKLLIQKMCYFADVTAGQKLEEMDISVHCDIVIFDWLMRWVKKDIIKKSEWPILEPSNVIPITVSASFLQMEPLLEQCLIFCHQNMSEVLKTSTILTCLNDNIFTRLAELFTNMDVEALKDKKDKVQSRLFCKLIISLGDPIPDTRRGHYSSLATIFKCAKCGKNVIRSLSEYVPCIPSAMRIDSKGNIYSKHTRDLNWSLNDYITNLRTELRSWRKVYWRLWGDCHFLNCRQCNAYFPVNQMDWCCYHPDNPQFFANEQQRTSSFPLGRYPCCSQRAYRFEALANREGCKFKEHIPAILADNDGHVLNTFAMYRDVIAQEPAEKFYPEKITRLVARDPSLLPGKLLCKEAMWWDGIELVPPRSKFGLLAKIWGGPMKKPSSQLSGQDGHKHRSKSKQFSNIDVSTSYSPPSSASDSEEDETATGYGDSTVDEESDNSEESNSCPTNRLKIRPRYNSIIRRNEGVRCWSMNLVVRYNQDNQRDYEERAALQMISLLTKKTLPESSSIIMHKSHKHGWHNQPIGGTYIKLEAEFREQSNQTYKNSKNSLSHNNKGPGRSRSLKG